jgi:hypothetical protein
MPVKYRQQTDKEKILSGMDLVHDRLINYKIQKNSKIIVIRNGKIEKLDPKFE